MSSNPSDPRPGAAVGPDRVVVVGDDTVVIPERTVVVPDAAPPAPARTPRRRLGPPMDTTALWVIGFLVAMLVIVAVFIWLLAPEGDPAVRAEDGGAVAATDTIDPDSRVGGGLALAAPDAARTHTINVAGDQDLFALAGTSGAADTYGGATVTADGVEVTQQLGERAFEVANASGATMVVYLPYATPDDVFVTIGQEVTFVGSVSPTPEDLTTVADATAATAAAGDGAYIIAVPESVHVVPPSLADDQTAA
jgi:hypothetical protein